MAVLVTKYVVMGTFADYIRKCMLMSITERVTMDHIICFTSIKDLYVLDCGWVLSHVGKDLHASLRTAVC